MTMTTDEPRTGRILDEDIRTLRERIDIEDVVSQYVTLRGAGAGSMKGLCPFHDEKSPSFTVRPQAGFFHCFGCGNGGDVIKFVQEIENLDFPGAIEHLAQRTGMTLRYTEGGGGHRRGDDPRKRGRLIAANDAAQQYFASQLMSPEAFTARQFLAARGFDRNAALDFGIGYAPRGWDSLYKHMRSLGYSDDELTTVGLMSEGARGVYDRFRGRLMWPIRDVTGDPIGFGARKLYDDDPGPKYLNTPETPLYKKSQVLYGIDRAKRDIAKGKQVVVVEGYTDVMAMHLAGVTTAVATCGTAFGTDHIRLVRRLMGDTNQNAAITATGGQVVFTFDGDAAGQKAALRAFGDDQMFSAQTYVAVAPGGQDPCELRIGVGDQAVRDLVRDKRPLFEFVIQSVLNAHDLSIAEGRVAALRAAAPVVASIRDAALRPEYVRLLGGWLGLDPATVGEAVRTAPPPRVEAIAAKATARVTTHEPVESVSVGIPMPDRRDPHYKIERCAMEAVLQRPGAASDAGFDDLPADTFSIAAYAAIHAAVTASGGATAALGDARDASSEVKSRAVATWLDTVIENIPEELRSVLTELVVAPMPQDDDALTAYVTGVMRTLRLDVLKRQADVVTAELGRLDPADPAYRDLSIRLFGLEQERYDLRTADVV